jgi:hypothetical protein
MFDSKRYGVRLLNDVLSVQGFWAFILGVQNDQNSCGFKVCMIIRRLFPKQNTSSDVTPTLSLFNNVYFLCYFSGYAPGLVTALPTYASGSTYFPKLVKKQGQYKRICFAHFFFPYKVTNRPYSPFEDGI